MQVGPDNRITNQTVYQDHEILNRREQEILVKTYEDRIE